MDTFRLKFLELEIEGQELSIGLRVKGPYNPAVKEPKLAVIFDNGKEKRRLPVLQQAYFPEKDLESFVFFAKYTYRLDCLYLDAPLQERIEFWFEFTYGDMVIEHMPFYRSGDIKVDEIEDYTITFSEDETRCICVDRIIKTREPEREEAKRGTLRSIIGSLWTVGLYLAGIGLLPLFLVEGILVMLGCVKRVRGNKKEGILHLINHVRLRFTRFARKGFGITDAKHTVMNFGYWLGSLREIQKNRIVFFSNRRNDMTGNFEFVNNILKQDPDLDLHYVLDDRNMKNLSFANTFRYGYNCAAAKVILVDDYVAQLYSLPRREGSSMIQLWHACGAFKTFGYSRLGKPGGQKQTSRAHRNYDYCIVSSQEIAKFYAEGFGISLDKPVATGIPRTDIFFDAAYKEKVTTEFYNNYPQLREKKILLFAPTFRGKGKNSGYYPVEKFDVGRLYEELDGEYAIIVKHHPFVKDRNEIPEQYQDYIIDLSENSELNDLLFVTDLLVTDYSSSVFEAALLDIPMLFFAYDLQRYISTRGFYYEYEEFVPGKIVSSFGQAVTAIRNQDLETEKIAAFKTRFFDDLDGKSSQRTVDLIYKALKK